MESFSSRLLEFSVARFQRSFLGHTLRYSDSGLDWIGGQHCGSVGKASAYNSGDLGSIPGLGRSPGEGNGNPFQFPCLENPIDGGEY